jgi:hypothetical protein
MIDDGYILKDAGLVAASATGQVDGEDFIADIGAARMEAKMVVDVSAIEIASDNEIYQIALQGSDSATFNGTTGAITTLAILELGANEVIGGDVDSVVGRYEVPFSNDKAGTVYPYVREYCTCNGSISTGINFSAYLAKL